MWAHSFTFIKILLIQYYAMSFMFHIYLHQEWDSDLQHTRTANIHVDVFGKFFPKVFPFTWKSTYSGKLPSLLLLVHLHKGFWEVGSPCVCTYLSCGICFLGHWNLSLTQLPPFFHFALNFMDFHRKKKIILRHLYTAMVFFSWIHINLIFQFFSFQY